MKNTYKAYTGALWVRDCPFVALTSFIISATATHFLSLSLYFCVMHAEIGRASALYSNYVRLYMKNGYLSTSNIAQKNTFPTQFTPH